MRPNFDLLLIQSPIICYAHRNTYRAVSGLFTVSAIKKASIQNAFPKDEPVRILLLKNKPPVDVRKTIIQYELTTNLLDRCFISDTKKISTFLRAWFVKDDGKRSIFQSKEWLTLYPDLTSADKVAKYLSVSKKDL
ncbi:hypothetical protein CS022_20285 [Veronia nyctiphanis]|uniref:Uncharacterized protein n=1 Tax=Veronia nyctiphanis TaxID=1278244 RepID=A0A4Q0YRF2_9GAMM|nr:hypothetical protein CS022_20285 [Veronia nyctiphanis]